MKSSDTDLTSLFHNIQQPFQTQERTINIPHHSYDLLDEHKQMCSIDYQVIW